jgi:hypothetical protein
VVEPALIVGSVHDEHVQAVVAAMGDSYPLFSTPPASRRPSFSSTATGSRSIKPTACRR